MDKIEFTNGSSIKSLNYEGKGFRSHGYFMAFDVAKEGSDQTFVTWKRNGVYNSGKLLKLDSENMIAIVEMSNGEIRKIILP